MSMSFSAQSLDVASLAVLNFPTWPGEANANALSVDQDGHLSVWTCLRNIVVCPKECVTRIQTLNHWRQSDVYHADNAYAFILRLYAGMESPILGDPNVPGRILDGWKRYKAAFPEAANLTSKVMEHIIADGREIRGYLVGENAFQPVSAAAIVCDVAACQVNSKVLIEGEMLASDLQIEAEEFIKRLDKKGITTGVLARDSTERDLAHKQLSALHRRGIVQRMPAIIDHESLRTKEWRNPEILITRAEPAALFAPVVAKDNFDVTGFLQQVSRFNSDSCVSPLIGEGVMRQSLAEYQRRVAHNAGLQGRLSMPINYCAEQRLSGLHPVRRAMAALMQTPK